MSLLRFRVMYEEDDSVYRDIEIRPAQSFEDLEAVIISSYNMPAGGSGNIFMSNDNWQKGKQIYPVKTQQEKKTNAKAKAITLPSIVAFIDDPHQHFIYEFHGNSDYVFLIELMAIGGVDKSSTMYPVMVKSQGASPFKKEEMAAHFAKHKSIVPEAVPETEIEEDGEDEEVSPFVESSSEADEDELASIEGEEGEEEVDIMEGDAIKEDQEESDSDEPFATNDDFDPEELGGSITEDFDEEI